MNLQDGAVVMLITISSILFGLVAGTEMVDRLTWPAVTIEKALPDPDVVVVQDKQKAQDKARKEAEKVMSSASLTEAIIWSRPYMYDHFEELDAGSLMLAAWSANHLTFADVVIKKNQVGLAQLVFHVDSERGRTICVRGRINAVQQDPLVSGAIRGFLSSTIYGEVAFVGVGKLASNPVGSVARYCGIYTGLYSYQDDDSVQKNAIKVIGVFDEKKGETL